MRNGGKYENIAIFDVATKVFNEGDPTASRPFYGVPPYAQWYRNGEPLDEPSAILYTSEPEMGDVVYSLYIGDDLIGEKMIHIVPAELDANAVEDRSVLYDDTLSYRVTSLDTEKIKNGENIVGTIAVNGYNWQNRNALINLVVPETVTLKCQFVDEDNNEFLRDYTFVVTEVSGFAVIKGEGYVHTVELPKTITKIEYAAFYGNKNLTQINLPSGLKEIGVAAFANTQLKSVVIPGSLKEINPNTFCNNQIESLVIEEGVEHIYKGAFSNNKLTEITLPASLKSLNVLADKDTHQEQTHEIINVFEGNDINTIYLHSPHLLELIKADPTILKGATSVNVLSRSAKGIIDLYLPEITNVSYADNKVKYEQGDTITLTVNIESKYRQVEMFDARSDTFIGKDENAELRPCTFQLPVAIQWYRDGVAIPNATNATYTIEASELGNHKYSVSVEDEKLEEVIVEVVKKDESNTENPGDKENPGDTDNSGDKENPDNTENPNGNEGNNNGNPSTTKPVSTKPISKAPTKTGDSTSYMVLGVLCVASLLFGMYLLKEKRVTR